MNDPNGLAHYDGEYPLFHQYNPHGDRWGHMSRGHAVSRDLTTWKELPVAIPETEVMAFSRSAVIDWNNTSGLGKGDLTWSASAKGGAATSRKLDAWTLARPKAR